MTTICPECAKPMQRICQDCGCFFDTPELVVNDLYNYRPRPRRVYNRLDHFKEVLGQFQGREGKDIPTEVLDKIRDEIDQPLEATSKDIKKVLRKLKLNKYIENTTYILFAITGKQPPYIPREVEDKTIKMFKQIDRAYCSIYKDERKSFLNYNYILYKLLELMRQDEILPRIPILRTRVRLRQHDIIWHQICSELDWTYKPTPSVQATEAAKNRKRNHREP